MGSFSSQMTPQDARKQYIKTKGNSNIQNVIDYKNKSVYGYGGKTNITNRWNHQNSHHALVDYSPGFHTTSKWNQSVDSAPRVIERDYNHKVNDYSKNVSQTIFTPGLGAHSYKKRTTYTPGKQSRRNMKQFHPLRTNAVQPNKGFDRSRANKPRSASKSYRSSQMLSRQIERERK